MHRLCVSVGGGEDIRYLSLSFSLPLSPHTHERGVGGVGGWTARAHAHLEGGTMSSLLHFIQLPPSFTLSITHAHTHTHVHST